MSTYKEKYREVACKGLQEKFNYANSMLLPRFTKIVVNMGIAEAVSDKNVLQDCVRELAAITGQKPILTKARKSIAGFKLREGQQIGAKVTLRGQRMFDFMARFIDIVCPRIRDFRGLTTACDGQGNYTVGLDDQQVFPEVNLDDVKRTQGMNITFVTTATTDDECRELLRLMGMPFKKPSDKKAAA